MTNNITSEFELCAGIWEWWFRDKETLKPLSSLCKIELKRNKTKMSFVTPPELIDRPNTVIFIQRTR